MSFTQATIRTQFASLLDISPNKLTVTYGGDEYDAVKTQLSRELQYSEWGIQNDYRFSVLLSVSDFDTLPSVDDTCTVGGTEYRILNIEQDSTDVSIKLDLGQLYG